MCLKFNGPIDSISLVRVCYGVTIYPVLFIDQVIVSLVIMLIRLKVDMYRYPCRTAGSQYICYRLLYIISGNTIFFSLHIKKKMLQCFVDVATFYIHFVYIFFFVNDRKFLYFYI